MMRNIQNENIENFLIDYSVSQKNANLSQIDEHGNTPLCLASIIISIQRQLKIPN